MSQQVQDLIEQQYGMHDCIVQEYTDFTKFKFTRSHFTIEHSGSRYFLKISEWTDKDFIVNEARISQQFNKHYFLHCPKIIENNNGLPYSEYQGKIVVLYQYIDEKNLLQK